MRRHGTKRNGIVWDKISIEQEDGTENNNTRWDRTGSDGTGGASMREVGTGMKGDKTRRDGKERKGTVR